MVCSMSHCYIFIVGWIEQTLCGVFWLNKYNFLLVEQTCRCHVLCVMYYVSCTMCHVGVMYYVRKILIVWSTMVTQLRHLGVVKILRVVFDILFGDKF